MRHLFPVPVKLPWLAAVVWAACLGGSGNSPAQSAEPEPHALRLSGFGTAGVSHASAPPRWGLQREGEQARNEGGTRFDTDSRLGLQANYAINSTFDVVGQLLLTRRLSAATSGDAVAWAFAAYRPTENLAIRAGRVSVNVYELSDHRSVGLAYPFVRPPTEFYSLLPNAIDGLDVSQSWRDAGDAIWKLAAYGGNTQQADTRSGSFTKIRPIYGVFFSREEPGLIVKASMSRVRLAGSAPAAPLVAALRQVIGLPVPQVAAEAAALSQPFVAGQLVDYFGLGLNFDRDDWLLVLEASHARVRGSVALDAGYALLGRRLGAVTPYVVISAVHSRAERPSPHWTAALTAVLGPDGAAQVQALGDLAYRAATIGPLQRTSSIGLRWDLSSQTALKLQYDRTRISAQGSLLWANGSDEAASAHVLSATFDFVF